jgi:tetratricopeptide (TPR) repeat protein/tRNA A-37 threonylcarbamoyl transferase component Bud32
VATPETGPDRWRRLEELFQAAADRNPSERAAFLAEACGADPALRKEVESLLESADETLGFLANPVGEAAREIAGEPALEGQRIGPYRLLQVLGEGGMGTVYLAARADEHYERQVAIKLMHAKFGRNAAMHARFRAERQILANLDHSNIARLLDGGMTPQGAPYLVMEHVDGVPINEYCRRKKLTVPERLRLFGAVCGAVEYAHHSLVVHRDIKPANILVTATGVPKLLDFGIAKLLDPDFGDTAPTRTTDRLMTPEYASPEQIRGEPVTTATDVYELGVLLYELLAGRRPFGVQTRSPLEVARLICEQDPQPPSAVVASDPETAPPDARKVKGELDKVVLMAMRKEPARRYASVGQLSADVRAYLDGYPLVARTDTWGYRSTKFVRRHKAAVGAAAFMALALVGFSIGMGLLARRAAREQLIAQREAQFLSGMFQAATPEQARGRTITARELLDLGAARIDRELVAEPEVRASLLVSIANAYRSLGIFDEAEALAERSYHLEAQRLGQQSPETAVPLEIWGTVLRLKGQYQRAEALFRQLVALRRKALGDNDSDVAQALGALGECLYLEAKDGEAEPILRQSLAIYRRSTPDLGDQTRNYLALLLERKGQNTEAIQLLRDAVEISRRTTGADSPNYAISLHNLGSALISLGDLSGAEAQVREALAIRRKVLGDNHPDVFYSLNNMAFVLLNRGDWAGAEPFAREALALSLRLGSQHPFVATSRNGVARVLQARGEYAEAEKQFQAALTLLRNTGQGEGWSAAQITMNLGVLDFERARFPQAEALHRQALEALRRLGGENTPLVSNALIELAEDRMFQHDPKSAEPFLREALEIRRKTLSQTNPAVIAAETRLGEDLIAEGEPAQAEPILRQALQSARTAPFPLVAWQMADVESALDACLIARGSVSTTEAATGKSAPGLRFNPRPAFRKPATVRLAWVARGRLPDPLHHLGGQPIRRDQR